LAEQTIWVGAVAYDPKVVTIWEGMREYFRREACVPVDIVLFQSYDAQVAALLAPDATVAPRIDIAWNTNLAYLQSIEWSSGACRAIAMRDTDLGWTTHMIALAGGPVQSLADVRGRTLAVGSQDSGHAAILPVHFLEQAGLLPDRDFRLLRFNTDLGKHGDTGTSEVDVLGAVLDGRADAGMVGSPFWAGVEQQKLVPAGAVTAVWSSPPYTHCMFTARPGLDPEIARRFADALYGMHCDNPAHRPVLEADGLRKWLPADIDGYESLTEACRKQGFFRRPA
jgi:ABC-type phosphate/phosphonate transport system substrate-binding protein